MLEERRLVAGSQVIARESDGSVGSERANRGRSSWHRAALIGCVIGGLLAGVLLMTAALRSTAPLAGPEPASRTNLPPRANQSADMTDQELATAPFDVPAGFKARHQQEMVLGATRNESWLIYQPTDVVGAVGASMTLSLIRGDSLADVPSRLASGSDQEKITAARTLAEGDYELRVVGGRSVATRENVQHVENPHGQGDRGVDLHVLAAGSPGAVVELIAEGVDQPIVDSVIASLQL